jgi:tetratricopeptide (TPR) repeat protein
LRAGFFEKARDRWRACQTLQPDNHFYAMSLGESLVCIGELEGAFEAFGRAAARQPADAGECWRRLGDLLKKRGDADSAAEAYSRAIAAAPQNALYHLRLASCYASAGKVDLAAATLIRAKELPPTLPAR